MINYQFKVKFLTPLDLLSRRYQHTFTFFLRCGRAKITIFRRCFAHLYIPFLAPQSWCTNQAIISIMHDYTTAAISSQILANFGVKQKIKDPLTLRDRYRTARDDLGKSQLHGRCKLPRGPEVPRDHLEAGQKYPRNGPSNNLHYRIRPRPGRPCQKHPIRLNLR